MHLQHDSDMWTLCDVVCEGYWRQAIHQVFSFNFFSLSLSPAVIVIPIKLFRIMLLLILYCCWAATMSCLCILYAFEILYHPSQKAIFFNWIFHKCAARDRQERFILIITWRLLDHFSHTERMTWNIFSSPVVFSPARAVQWIINFNVSHVRGCEKISNLLISEVGCKTYMRQLADESKSFLMELSVTKLAAEIFNV